MKISTYHSTEVGENIIKVEISDHLPKFGKKFDLMMVLSESLRD